MSLVGDLSALQLVTFDALVHFGSLNFLHHFFRGFKNNNMNLKWVSKPAAEFLLLI